MEQSKFEDENIIESRYWAKRKKYTGIDTGVYSREEIVEFYEVRLFQNKAGVVLPALFKDMSQEEAKRKYHSEQRPQIIKTNKDGSINFALNLVNQKIEAKQLEAVVRDFSRLLNRLYPTDICLNIETGQGINLPFAFMEFTSCAVNENLYNMLVISPVGEQLLMLLFNCPYEERNDWVYCLSQIREHITWYSEEDKNEAN